MLKLTNVEKKYKDHIVFSSVTIDMSEPVLYIFQGINGSGKSTILKVIAGIIYKTEGRLEKDIRISYLPDKFSLPKLMNVKSYVKSILKMEGKEKLTDELIGLYQIPCRRIGELSKGNQQKLGLLQILSKDSECYLLDEPLDGLDDYAKHLIKSIISDYINDGKIIIMSLHAKNLFNEFKPHVYDVKDGLINEKKRRRKNEDEEEE